MSTEQSSINYLPLFDPPAQTRRVDPASSYRAEQKMRTTGAMQSNAEKLLRTILKCPGLSTKELSEVGGMDRHEAGRRASNLWKAGLVIRGHSKSHDMRLWAVLYSNLKSCKKCRGVRLGE